MMNPLLLPELIALVADKFGPKEAVRPSRVCRSWNIAFNPIVWCQILVDENDPNFEVAIQALTNNAHHIRCLTIWDLALFSKFTPPCTLLTELVLNGALTKFSDAEAAENWDRLTHLIQSNPHLRTVRIASSEKLATTEFWKSLASCSRIHLSSLKMNLADIQAFWESCRHVQVLDIGDLTRLVDTITFFEEACDIYSNLERFVVNSVPDSPVIPQIMFLANCPNLKSFSMDFQYASPQQGLPGLAFLLRKGFLPRLESLHLSHSVKDHLWALCLRSMTSVRSLDCTKTGFGPLAFKRLTRHFTTIQTLRLSNCRKVNGDMIQTILESCPMLEAFWSPKIPASRIRRGKPWVCVGLQRLSLFVTVENSSAEKIREQTWAVFHQLAQLTQLVSLSIGSKHVKSRKQGLDLRLKSGMGQLKGLEKLEELSFVNTKQDMHLEDISWMRGHFRRLMRVKGQCNRYGDYFKQPLIPEDIVALNKPKVLIVGAGIGGLTLGILLKKGGIPFEIYERAKETKPLGKPAREIVLGWKIINISLFQEH